MPNSFFPLAVEQTAEHTEPGPHSFPSWWLPPYAPPAPRTSISANTQHCGWGFDSQTETSSSPSLDPASANNCRTPDCQDRQHKHARQRRGPHLLYLAVSGNTVATRMFIQIGGAARRWNGKFKTTFLAPPASPLGRHDFTEYT